MGVAIVPRKGQVLITDTLRHLVVVFAGVDDDTVIHKLCHGEGHDLRQLFGPYDMAVLDEGNAADRLGQSSVVLVSCARRCVTWDQKELCRASSSGQVPCRWCRRK
jgi:hypothetical protein